MRARSVFPFLLSTLLSAFALRVYRLNHHDIWGDEAFSIWLSKQPLDQVMAGGADTHPPFYPFMLHLWLRVAGDSPFAVRFLSLIPGVLLVALVYVLGCRLVSHRVGLVAAVLTTASPFAVYYSQETRMYAWVVTLSALSVYAFLCLPEPRIRNDKRPDTTRNTPSSNWLLIYLIATLAAIYAHYYAFFVLLTQNVFVLWHWRRLHRFLLRWFASQAGIALAYVPWILVQMSFLQGKAHARFEAWGATGLWDVWVGTLKTFGVGTTVPSKVEWLALLPLLMVGLGAVVASRRRPGRMAVLWLVIPLVIAWLVNPIMPFFYARYLIVALPAYLLLLAAGVMWLGRRHILASAVGGVLVLTVSGYSLYNYYAVPVYAKGGYGELMAYVEARSRPGDALLLENPLQKAIYDYYAPHDMPAYWFPLEHSWDDPRTQAHLEGLTEAYDRLWLVMFGNPAEYDPNHELERWLSAHGFRTYRGDYVDASLALYTMGRAGTEPVEVSARFAEKIQLLSYSLNTDTVTPGGTLALTLNWQSLAEMDRDYTIFAHLIDENQKIWAQMDSQPRGGTLPTSAWTPGERVTDRLGLQLDAEIPAGIYQIEVGWYYLPTLERLPVVKPTGQANGDRILLGPVCVANKD